MAVKPETTFTKSITRLLPKSIYHMKNNNPYIGGIPDMWFSGNGGDLWIEMKFIPRIPQRGVVDPTKLLTALQLHWLNGRYDEGRNIAVIIGCPTGGVLLRDRAWEAELTHSQFTSLIRSRADLADWIKEQTTR